MPTADRAAEPRQDRIVGLSVCYSRIRRHVRRSSDPLMPEEIEKVIREMPRGGGVIELLKKFSDEGPLPAR